MQIKERKFLGATVSAILERFHEGQLEVLLQIRWKPEDDPKHSGLLEVPGGRIGLREDVYAALKREVKEECGLEIQIITPRRETQTVANDT